MWDGRQIDTFDHLISVLCSSSVLWLPRHENHFVMLTDASFQGVDAVLSAVRGDIEQPVGYYSRAFIQTAKNYAATEI